MAAKRIAVTGGYGFIGSALIRLLLAETDCEVLNIDKLTYAASLASIPQAEGNPKYRFVKADIADAAVMRKVFEEFQPDAVMHLAAESHVDRSIDGPQGFIAINVVGVRCGRRIGGSGLLSAVGPSPASAACSSSPVMSLPVTATRS
jgi:dTDP-glucose 4,6-dehydratase